MQLLATGPLPPLFLGPDGAGKSSMIRYCLKSSEEQGGLHWKHLRLCARTRACDVQAFIETGLEKKRKTKLGPPAGFQLIVFVDDVNVVEADGFGTQPALEQLRQLQDQKVGLQCLFKTCSHPSHSGLAQHQDQMILTQPQPVPVPTAMPALASLHKLPTALQTSRHADAIACLLADRA